MRMQRAKVIVVLFLVFVVVFIIGLLWYLSNWEKEVEAQGALIYASLAAPWVSSLTSLARM